MGSPTRKMGGVRFCRGKISFYLQFHDMWAYFHQNNLAQEKSEIVTSFRGPLMFEAILIFDLGVGLTVNTVEGAFINIS